MLNPEILLKLNSSQPPAGSVESIYGLMLYGAIKNGKPDHVLELGTGAGYSTAWMLLGLEENESGHLWTADLIPAENPIWIRVGLPTQRLTYFSNDPIDSLKNKLPDLFDFVFHDAGHSWDEVEKDLEWILPRLRVGGHIVIHDVTYSPNVGDALLEYFDSKTDEWKYERIVEGCGVGIATRIKEAEVTKCKDESNGSTMEKGSGLSQEKTEKITSRIIPKSKRLVIGRLKKIKPSRSTRSRKQKGRGPKALSLNGVE